jgi:hypothetical protein
MSVSQTVAEVPEKYIGVEVERIDRMFLDVHVDVHVPQLQTVGGTLMFKRIHHVLHG